MLQGRLFTSTQSDWRPPSFNDLPSWEGIKRIGLDTEDREPALKTLGISAGRRPNSYVTGISFAIEDGPGFYLPIRHAGGDNLPEEGVLAYLRDNAKLFKGDIVGANLQFDLDELATDGVLFPQVRYFRDIQIADPLIYELHDSYSLQNIAMRRGFAGKDEAMLRRAAAEFHVDPKKDMWMLPARYIGAYAEEDARLPLSILRAQEREIDDQGLWDVYNMESKLLPILVKMRRRGVLVDQDRLAQVERWAADREREALAEVKHLTGIEVGFDMVWKADAIAAPLRHIGVQLGKTSTGKPQIDKDLLSRIKHPVAEALARARKVNKLRTTFAASVRNHMTADGRIHCTLNQLRRPKEDGSDDEGGARYGRLSSEHPNMQQQPSRGDFAMMWRAIYVPEPGALWAACDYSQQEPRMAVHYACKARSLLGESVWRTAIAARDHYRNDPNADNHQMMADMAKIGRKQAKEIYLGLSYGMGGAKLCRQLGLPTRWVVRGPRGILYDRESKEGQYYLSQGGRTYEAAGEEGQKLLDTFDQKVPFVRKLAKACEKKAKERGYITTLSGRRCHFPKSLSGEYDWTHKALNRLIQGSAADQTKEAMIQADEAGFDLMLQVHDEIAFNVDCKATAERAADVMRHCVQLELPSKVDVEIGKSWGHSMGYEAA